MRDTARSSLARRLPLAVALLAATAGRPGPRGLPPERVVDFQHYRFGVPPAEFEFTATGPSGPVLSAGRPMWRVYVDRFAPSPPLVLIQASALARADHYPMALLRDVDAADLSLSVSFRPMGGELSRAAGVAWRAVDRDNYYAALADARQRQVRLLKVVKGRVQQIASAEAAVEVEFERRDGPSPTHGWHTLDVEAAGDRIRVWLDGKEALSRADADLPGPGRIGLVTGADGRARFVATLAPEDPEGIYTARVTAVSRADVADEGEARASAPASSVRFFARPGPPPKASLAARTGLPARVAAQRR